VVGDTDRFVQRLNDSFANPSGGAAPLKAVQSQTVPTESGERVSVTPPHGVGESRD
jgi:hypothetical protein